MTDRLAAAREAMARRDYKAATEICDKIIADEDSLSARDLCALSVIYMDIVDRTGDDDHVASAAQCYMDALARDSIQAKSYFDSLQLNDAAHVFLLDQIVDNIREPRSIDADSYDLPGDTTATGDYGEHAH